MNVNTQNRVSLTEINQNFFHATRMDDKSGSGVILKNNTPSYPLIEFNRAEEKQIASNEDIHDVSKCLIAKNRKAYDLLAK